FCVIIISFLYSYCYAPNLSLHSFPTRRSSDLIKMLLKSCLIRRKSQKSIKVFQKISRVKRNSTPIHSIAWRSSKSCLYSATSRSMQIRLADNAGLPLFRPADSISCLIGVGAPSDYKPPNGGFIYLQKQLYRLLPEIP